MNLFVHRHSVSMLFTTHLHQIGIHKEVAVLVALTTVSANGGTPNHNCNSMQPIQQHTTRPGIGATSIGLTVLVDPDLDGRGVMASHTRNHTSLVPHGEDTVWREMFTNFMDRLQCLKIFTKNILRYIPLRLYSKGQTTQYFFCKKSNFTPFVKSFSRDNFPL